MPPARATRARSLFVNKSAERARFTWQIAQVHPSPAFIYFADVKSFICRVVFCLKFPKLPSSSTK
jgi:hypothetical protein